MAKPRYFIERDYNLRHFRYKAWVTLDGKHIDESTDFEYLDATWLKWTAKRLCRRRARQLNRRTREAVVEEVHID